MKSRIIENLISKVDKGDMMGQLDREILKGLERRISMHPCAVSLIRPESYSYALAFITSRIGPSDKFGVVVVDISKPTSRTQRRYNVGTNIRLELKTNLLNGEPFFVIDFTFANKSAHPFLGLSKTQGSSGCVIASPNSRLLGKLLRGEWMTMNGKPVDEHIEKVLEQDPTLVFMSNTRAY